MRAEIDSASATPLSLCLADVGLALDGRVLLDQVNVTLCQGGLTALLGPNGAGKSLLLRVAQGLVKPTRGSVTWSAPPRAGHVRQAMVFQRPVMLRRSVLGNIRHALAAAGLARPQREARAAETLRRFGFAPVAQSPARRLSGGEQQRLAIARAWSLNPEVMFLDEPTSSLDPGATRQIEAMVAELKDEGMTWVMATHDLGQARRLADRVVFVHRGRIVEDAPATTFFSRPASEEARAFLAGELLW